MKLIKCDNVSPLHPSMEAREHKYLKHLASAMSHYLESPPWHRAYLRPRLRLREG